MIGMKGLGFLLWVTKLTMLRALPQWVLTQGSDTPPQVLYPIIMGLSD